MAWLFALGAPLVGSFFDPASFSYSPPDSSYFLESFVAYRMAGQLALDKRLFMQGKEDGQCSC